MKSYFGNLYFPSIANSYQKTTVTRRFRSAGLLLLVLAACCSNIATATLAE